MTRAEIMPIGTVKPRDDVLVSICFGEISADTVAFDAIAELALTLEVRFRFYEIIVVAEDNCKDDYISLIKKVSNLRLITIRDGTAFYRRRAVAAGEAIGDVVLLVSATELSAVDAIGMIERAADEQSAVLATRGSKDTSRSLGALLVFLGRIAGFKVNLHDLQTLALPRTLLNQLLAHPDPDLALRFPPRDIRVPVVREEVASGVSVPRDAGLRRRILLLQKLLVYMAPRLLMAVTMTAALLAIFGFTFGIYALVAWIIQDELAPGWLTLSTAISLTAFFLGVAMTGLSLGLQQLLSQANLDSFESTVTEVNRIDLFGQVADDLNVEIQRSGRPDLRKTPRL